MILTYPYDIRGWEMTGAFAKKWWFTLKGCEELVEATKDPERPRVIDDTIYGERLKRPPPPGCRLGYRLGARVFRTLS